MTAVAGAEAAASRVPVLMYHRVEPAVQAEEAAYAVSSKLFTAQMAWLARHGWQPCTVRAFEAWICGRASLPARSVLITFDDGFAGLHEHVLPLLAARSWPATVFLVSGLIGQRDTWMVREHHAAAHRPLLGHGQIMEMARAGFDFHSHTSQHADLTALDDAALREHLAGSRLALQDLLGTAVDYLAYPFGRNDERVRAAAASAGYRLAFSVDPGFNRPGQERLAVRRLDITGRDTPACFGRKVTLGSNDGSFGQQWRYLVGRVRAQLGQGAGA
jgi:peptidoglycan/xylan/chitin deacetylase (PgdA/CDA1 family)